MKKRCLYGSEHNGATAHIDAFFLSCLYGSELLHGNDIS